MSVTVTVQVKRKRTFQLRPARSQERVRHHLLFRVGKKKGKGTAVTQFLVAYAEMQEQAQLRQMQHENKMQENAMAFQAIMEQDRVKFEADLSASSSSRTASSRWL